MGYYVRFLPKRKSTPNWKLQFMSRKKEHTKGSTAKEPVRTWDIPKDRWPELGFRKYMTMEQARIRQRQLNAQLHMKRHEERRIKFEQEAKQLELQSVGYLPEVYREQFEQRYFSGCGLRRAIKNKEISHWRAAQRIILEIQLEPADWYDEAPQFYDWFFKKRYSFGYVVKIIRFLNLWGFFISRKLGKPFYSIPKPRGAEKSRLLDTYFQKRGTSSNQSDPITPKQLEKAKSKLLPEQYNWFFLSVWFGLRPSEIDRLKNPQNLRIMKDADGTSIVWVYQEKLVSVPPRYRWKLIPAFLEEQREGLRIIEQGNFERPLAKTAKRYFGKNSTLYGGRKGFTDLMMSHGQDFINISQWMGHSSIQRTWQNYKSRLHVHFHEPAA